MGHLEYAPTDTREQRRAKYEAWMDAQPCSACQYAKDYEEKGRLGPLTDDHCGCSRCDWAGSGQLLHSCKTGWRHKLCDRCNESA